MHGYMMPLCALENNSKMAFTWLHYAPSKNTNARSNPAIPGFSVISIQKRGAELPSKARAQRDERRIRSRIGRK
jgi:hypothetical protein